MADLEIKDSLHKYDVEFYTKDGFAAVRGRYNASNVFDAISKAANSLSDDIKAQGADHGTKVMLVDIEAEAKEREDNVHLYEMAAMAELLFTRYGFTEREGRAFKNASIGLVASVDHHSSPEYNRYAGVLQMQLAPNGREVMVPFVLIPWYGDGLPMDSAEALLEAVLQTVTK